ncbi:MAG TPA: BPSS1780 family membrane protein [Trinickia sp.]|uniref:BPSS1780 family membrane protein n=1 Tax=Trinickia sp. TaxID=2571163 RepID=UPI002B99CC5C|nr:BPSS1780 family membrane protein [Trinickia sp.]HTI19067.1 BPSS1780 family membrane protein [Trinickia sp.]
MNIDYPSAVSRETRIHSAPALRFPAGHEVNPLRFLAWLAAGWRAVSMQPVLWLSIALLCADFVTLLGLLPLLRPLAVLLAPLVVGALMFVQEGASRNEPVSFRDMCTVIVRHSNALCVIGLYAVATVAIGYVVLLATFDVSLMASVTANGVHSVSISYGGAPGLRGTLEAMCGASIYAIAVAAACFAPALVVLHDMTPLDAMIASLSGALRNWQVTLGCFLLMTLAVLFMPTMPFAVRALVMTPVLTALPLLAIYGAYRDVFVGK